MRLKMKKVGKFIYSAKNSQVGIACIEANEQLTVYEKVEGILEPTGRFETFMYNGSLYPAAYFINTISKEKLEEPLRS